MHNKQFNFKVPKYPTSYDRALGRNLLRLGQWSHTGPEYLEQTRAVELQQLQPAHCPSCREKLELWQLRPF